MSFVLADPASSHSYHQMPLKAYPHTLLGTWLWIVQAGWKAATGFSGAVARSNNIFFCYVLAVGFVLAGPGSSG